MSASQNYKVEVYLKLIDYKRSIGITQWTVLSIFVTASAAVFVLGLRQADEIVNPLVLIFALMIYWLGFLLYRRYRRLNRAVSNYLVRLEDEIGVGFQKHLDEKFYTNERLSTKNILFLAGIIYAIFALVVIWGQWI